MNNKETENSEDETVNGARAAAGIINSYPSEKREKLLLAIQEASPETFILLKTNIFNLNDLPNVVGTGLQVLIRECNHEDLVVLIRYSNNAVKTKLLSNMSENKRQSILDDLKSVSKISAQQISAAKDRILSHIEELRTAGIIRTLEEELV